MGELTEMEEGSGFEFRPFDGIALSLSGGGYRATLFHLGTLSYLDHVKWTDKSLLEHVRIISTVSGGTITGLVYAMLLNRGASFSSIYQCLVKRITSIDLAGEAIKKLNPDGKWDNEFKSKNLINAFSELYDLYLFEGTTLNEFEKMQGHLEAVVFNCTEFQNGKNFKFCNKDARQVIGAKGNQLPWKVANTIKLADVLAASSCFPGGFEPMLWPQDFMHVNNVVELTPFQNRPTLGIMDGGIYDNQGLSVLLDYKKGHHNLVLLSDVSSPVFDAYKPFVLKSSRSKFSIKNLTTGIKLLPIILWGFFAISVFFSFFLWQFWEPTDINGFGQGLWVGVSLASAVMTGLILLLFYSIHWRASQFLKGMVAQVPPFYSKQLGQLNWQMMGWRQIQKLIMDRLLSVEKLLMDVNLKVIRQLNYNRLYKDETYLFRRMAVIIGGLTAEKWGINNPLHLAAYQRNSSSEVDSDYNSFYSEKFKTCVQDASDFGTQLWFTEHEFERGMPDKLIATGQATTCFQLLKYLDDLIHQPRSPFHQLSEPEQQSLRQMYQEVRTDFDQFRQDPYWMLLKQVN